MDEKQIPRMLLTAMIEGGKKKEDREQNGRYMEMRKWRPAPMDTVEWMRFLVEARTL